MDKLDFIIEQLARLDQKLDKVSDRIGACEVDLASNKSQIEAMKETIEEHREDDKRLAAKVEELNRYKWITVGVVSAITFGVNLAIKYLP